MKFSNRLNVLRAKVRGWRERLRMDQVKQNLTVWGNALVLMALSLLLVANVAAMVLWTWMLVQEPAMAWSPWNAAAMCLCILTTALAIRMMAR